MSRPLKRVQPMRASKAKRSKTEPIPELPDDILRLIIEALPTSDRTPLRLVSKRFRRLDLNTGKREFNAIDLQLDDEHDIFITYVSTGDSLIRSDIIETEPNVDYGRISSDLKMYFKLARTDTMKIFVRSPRDADAASVLSSLFSSLQCKRVEVSFGQEVSLEQAFSFLTGLKIGQNGVDVVQFHWNYKEQHEILQHIPNLNQLPSIKQLSSWYANDEGLVEEGETPQEDHDKERFLVNGATMLQLAQSAEEVRLRSTDCSAQQILEAFEVVCASLEDEKYLAIYVPYSVLDQLMNLAKENEKFQVSGDFGGRYNWFISDSIRGCELCVNYQWTDVFDYVSVDIYKIDNNGKAKNKCVEFQ